MIADFWQFAGWAALVALVLFTVTWVVSYRLDNYTLVDATWSYSLVILVGLYAWLADGDPLRKALAVGLAGIWSIRLGTYLAFRIARHHPKEDVRYAELRKRWKTNIPWNFYLVFLWQAGLIVVLSFPHLAATLNPASSISVLEWSGVALALVGMIGEAIADHQMGSFKKRHKDQPKAVCQEGLWHYSRHPNYFFEFTTWLGVWFFACGSPHGWMTLHAPVLMLVFLYRVTGIPLTEKCAVESKGENYRRYQRTTSAFIPWLPKSEPSSP